MTIPSRHKAVLNNERWNKAFGRQPTIDSVLEYVVAHWKIMQRHPAPDMAFSAKEPSITQYFCTSLAKNAKNSGIFGFFIPERVVGKIDEARQVLESRGRTDISYLTDRLEHPLEIVMEFKKLKPSKSAKGGNVSRKAYCADGMFRFVEGIYAEDCDVGLMVGLVEFTSLLPDTINGLKRAIQNPDMERILRCIENPDGKTTVTSKDLIFKSCEFETRHARDHVRQPDVLLGHLILAHQSDT